MTNFLLALQFLTIIPVKIKHINANRMSNSLVYFPAVGLLLGLFLAGMGCLLSYLNFERFSINIILVILLAILTGGLHLDGLADTLDAFLSRKSKEEKLKIMHDSNVGAMGVLGIASVILLKIAFLSSVTTPLKYLSLMLACILSRWSLLFTMFLFPYARNEGKAKVFIEGINRKIFFWATIITLIFVVLIWRIKGLLLFLMIIPCAYTMGRFIKERIGGITGDTLGATNELIEVIALFSICLWERSPL